MNQKIAQKILKKNKVDWEEVAEEFSHTRQNAWFELTLLAEYTKNNDKVLDLGCGNGRLYQLFQNKKVDYVGVDQSEKLINLAKQQFMPDNKRISHRTGEVRFMVSNALDIPFKSEEFNIILAIAFLHHIPSKKLRIRVLENCYSVLKPNGFLVLTVWNIWQSNLLSKYHIWPMIFGWRNKGLDYKDVFIPFKLRNKTIMRYHHAFTRPELKRLVKKAGFNIIECYFTRRHEKISWRKGYNIILVAKKA